MLGTIWEEMYYLEYIDAESMMWVTAAGNEIEVKNMSVKHIQNTLNMLLKSGNDFINKTWINIFKKELEARISK